MRHHSTRQITDEVLGDDNEPPLNLYGEQAREEGHDFIQVHSISNSDLPIGSVTSSNFDQDLNNLLNDGPGEIDHNAP